MSETITIRRRRTDIRHHRDSEQSLHALSTAHDPVYLASRRPGIPLRDAFFFTSADTLTTFFSMKQNQFVPRGLRGEQLVGALRVEPALRPISRMKMINGAYVFSGVLLRAGRCRFSVTSTPSA